jgi:ribosomal protein S27E
MAVITIKCEGCGKPSTYSGTLKYVECKHCNLMLEVKKALDASSKEA